ncbi:hypothetical protein [Maribacter dokdonensis]|uniref:hypothetical protein n=1 Tax=Maribacter dokdonensis TaxID=320912 RepID=UPI0009438F1A|nr:hypothetical protein [Maribacter dokdonensis]
MRAEIAFKLYESLESRSEDRQRFVIDFFGYQLHELEEDLLFESYKDVFKKELSNGNRLIFDWVSNYYSKDKRKELETQIENFVEARPEDDLPF